MYFAYLTKEIALVFPIAYVCLKLMEILYHQIYCEKMNITVLKNILYEVCPMLLAFVTLHVFMKLTVFWGWGNSYDQMGLSVLLEEGRLRYLFYGFIYYLMTCIIALYFLPITIPLTYWKTLSVKEKKYFMYLFFVLILSAAVVAYTITVREDFGTEFEGIPRAHLRYVCYLTVPYFIILFSIGEKNIENSKDYIRRGLTNIVFLFPGIVLWRGVTDASSIDQTSVAYLQKFTEDQIFVILAIGMIVVLIFTLLFRKFRKELLLIFALCVIITQGNNNYLKINSNKANYAINEKQQAETMELGRFIEENFEKNFLWIEGLNGESRRLADTYLNYANLYTAWWPEYKRMSEEETLRLDNLPAAYSSNSYNLQKIDYVILGKDDEIALRTGTQADIVLNNDYFIVYKLLMPDQTPRAKGKTEVEEGENCYIPGENWIFHSAFLKSENELVSTDGGALVYGPYIMMPAGKYTVTFEYQYLGEEISKDTAIGYVDIYSSVLDLQWGQYQQEIKAAETRVIIDDIELAVDIPNFEIRMFVNTENVLIKKITIFRSE